MSEQSRGDGLVRVEALAGRPGQALLLDGLLHVPRRHVDRQSVAGDMVHGLGREDGRRPRADDDAELDCRAASSTRRRGQDGVRTLIVGVDTGRDADRLLVEDVARGRLEEEKWLGRYLSEASARRALTAEVTHGIAQFFRVVDVVPAAERELRTRSSDTRLTFRWRRTASYIVSDLLRAARRQRLAFLPRLANCAATLPMIPAETVRRRVGRKELGLRGLFELNGSAQSFSRYQYLNILYGQTVTGSLDDGLTGSRRRCAHRFLYAIEQFARLRTCLARCYSHDLGRRALAPRRREGPGAARASSEAPSPCPNSVSSFHLVPRRPEADQLGPSVKNYHWRSLDMSKWAKQWVRLVLSMSIRKG